MHTRTPFAVGLALFAATSTVMAVSTRFSNFTPLASSAAPIVVNDPAEETPIALSSDAFSQRTLADRRTQNQLVVNSNSGSWDMVTSNETGPNAGRYLFMPFETGSAGVQRVDLLDPHYDTRTVTIVAPGEQGFVSGDASRWTPWGGYLTGEESWGTGSVKGRLFEVTNPVSAGLYGGEFFAQGQSFVLRVGAGGQFEGNTGPAITGAATWVPITDAIGGPIAGVSTVLPDGTIDGRVTADHATIRSTGYNRPEDIEIQTLADGTQLLYFNTTDSDTNASSTDGVGRTYNLNLTTGLVRLFADATTIDLATGAAVGGGFRNADNLAVDAEGNLYIVEDRNGGVDDDIWFAVDLNKDGDLLDEGEGLARWASNGTQGSEFTGLYFDLRRPNLAYVNIQHPSSGVDRLIEIRLRS